MHPLKLLTYLASSIFSIYMIAAGAALLLNSSQASALLGILVSAKQKQRIHRELPRLRKSQRIITGTGWLLIGLLIAGSIVLTLVIHRG